MKTLVVILALACAGLAYGYYSRHTGANQAAGTALQQQQTLSNQVAELRTKLALEQGTSIQTQSNLHSTLDRRVSQLSTTSNKLVQVGLLLTAAQTEKAQTQSALQAKSAQLAVLERERDELQRQLAAIPALESQIDEARQKAAKNLNDVEFLFRENRRLQVESNEMATRLEDVGFLRQQLSKAEDNAELQQRIAKLGRSARVDKRAPLELQPDGTVRVAGTSTPASGQ